MTSLRQDTKAPRERLSERFRYPSELGRAGNRARHRVLLAVKLVIAVSLLAFALRNVSLKAQVANWASLRLPHMALACFVILLGQAVAALRWVVLLRRWDVSLSVSQAFRLNMVGSFFNLVFPTSVGGDVVKAFFLARHSEKGSESLMSVVLTRFIGLIVLLLLGLFSGIAFAWSVLPHWMLVALAGVVVCSVVGGLIVLRSSWLERRSRTWNGGLVGKLRHIVVILHVLSRNYRLLSYLLFLSLIIQLLAIHGYYEAALAVGVRTSYLNFLVFMPIVIVATMIPISIFGLGIRENASVYLFHFVGITGQMSVSMSLTWLVAYLLVSLLGGVFLVTLEDSFLVRRSEGAGTAAPATTPLQS